MVKDSKFRYKGGTWVSDAVRAEYVRRRWREKEERGFKRDKSTVPEGFVRVTNCDTGEVELITYEEFERREDERDSNIK